MNIKKKIITIITTLNSFIGNGYSKKVEAYAVDSKRYIIEEIRKVNILESKYKLFHHNHFPDEQL